MAFRFRKSIRIAPGIRLNFSKGGVSASLGEAGATVNLSRRGVRGTVGLPGTGLSYSDDIVRTGRGRRRKQGDEQEVLPTETSAPTIIQRLLGGLFGGAKR